jgi:type IV pilus assembly protein PilM
MPKRDLFEAVKWEAKKQISFPPEDLIFDYIILEKIVKDKETHLSVLSFAISRLDVQEHINILRESSLTPMALDVIPMALLSSFDHNNEWEKGVNYALIDIGMEKTNLVILKDGLLKFAREIPFGGKEISLQFTESPSLPDNQKIDNTVFSVNESLISESLANKDKSKEKLTALLEHLILEVQRSFDYYKAQFREGDISTVFLSGGTSKLKGIEEILSENIKIACFVDDPFKNIKINYKKFKKAEVKNLSPLLTIAVGLALRRVGE